MNDVYQQVTDSIIQLMEEHGTNWTMPFSKISGRQHNAITGKDYQGINVLILSLFGEGESQWATYKQWKSKGAQVRKGSKGKRIVFFKMIDSGKSNSTTGEPVLFPMARWSTVFSLDQVDNAPEELTKPPAGPSPERHELVEQYIKNTGAIINYRYKRGAYYCSARDAITLPHVNEFSDTATSTLMECYYSTVFHELSHWTGHKSRINRDLSIGGYAFEELIAEIGAAFQCVDFDVSPAPRPDHAQYLNYWLEQLKGDKKFIFKAAASAEKACQFLRDTQVADEIAA